MSRLLPLLTGFLTVVVFLGLGVPLILKGRTTLGGVLAVLGVLRAALLARDLIAMRAEQDDEDDDEAEAP